MKALARISLVKTAQNQLIKRSSYLSSTTTSNDDDKKSHNNSMIPAAALFAGTAITTAGGYTLDPTTITILANAPLAAFGLVQVSGLAPIRYIINNKDTGKLSPLPFVSLYTNCANWTLYGYLQSDQTILIANAVGTVVGLIYTGLFYSNTKMNMMPYFAGSTAILGTMLSSPIWAGMEMSPQILGILYIHPSIYV